MTADNTLIDTTGATSAGAALASEALPQVQGTLWGHPTASRSQRQRAKARMATFVDCPDKLTPEARASIERIRRANRLGWDPALDEVARTFAVVGPEAIRRVYLQAKRELAGTNYLHARWLPFKQAQGPASVTGRPGDGRGARSFVALIAALRAHTYRNWAKQGRGDPRWLLEEWFEDQDQLGAEFGVGRGTVNRLVTRDPDLARFVVPIPRRRYEARRSGGASRVAPYRYLVAIEDPLLPEDVAPIAARMRQLLREFLDQPDRDGLPIAVNATRSDAASTTLAPSSAHRGADAPESPVMVPATREEGAAPLATAFFASDDRTQNVVRDDAPESCANSAQQIDSPEPGFFEMERHRSEESAEGDADFRESSAIGNGEGEPGDQGDERVGSEDQTPDGSTPSSSASAPPSVLSSSNGAESSAAALARFGGHRKAGRHDGQEQDQEGYEEREAAGEALVTGPGCGRLSERDVRLARVSAAAGTLCYDLLRELERAEGLRNGRDPQAQERSARDGVGKVLGVLVDAEAPVQAVAPFLYWLHDRIARHRAATDGVQEPLRGPSGYAYRTAQQLIADARACDWACARENAREAEEARHAPHGGKHGGHGGHRRAWTGASRAPDAVDHGALDDLDHAGEPPAAPAGRGADDGDDGGDVPWEFGSTTSTTPPAVPPAVPRERRALRGIDAVPVGVELTRDAQVEHVQRQVRASLASRMAGVRVARGQLYQASDASWVFVAARTFDAEGLRQPHCRRLVVAALAEALGRPVPLVRLCIVTELVGRVADIADRDEQGGRDQRY